MDTPPSSIHWPDQATRGERPSHHESPSEEHHSSLPPRRILDTNLTHGSPGREGEFDLEVTFGKRQEKGSDGSETEDGLMSGSAEGRFCPTVVTAVAAEAAGVMHSGLSGSAGGLVQQRCLPLDLSPLVRTQSVEGVGSSTSLLLSAGFEPTPYGRPILMPPVPLCGDRARSTTEATVVTITRR